MPTIVTVLSQIEGSAASLTGSAAIGTALESVTENRNTRIISFLKQAYVNIYINKD
jgi:hypothetical protein